MPVNLNLKTSSHITFYVEDNLIWSNLRMMYDGAKSRSNNFVFASNEGF